MDSKHPLDHAEEEGPLPKRPMLDLESILSHVEPHNAAEDATAPYSMGHESVTLRDEAINQAIDEIFNGTYRSVFIEVPREVPHEVPDQVTPEIPCGVPHEVRHEEPSNEPDDDVPNNETTYLYAPSSDGIPTVTTQPPLHSFVAPTSVSITSETSVSETIQTPAEAPNVRPAEQMVNEANKVTPVAEGPEDIKYTASHEKGKGKGAMSKGKGGKGLVGGTGKGGFEKGGFEKGGFEKGGVEKGKAMSNAFLGKGPTAVSPVGWTPFGGMAMELTYGKGMPANFGSFKGMPGPGYGKGMMDQGMMGKGMMDQGMMGKGMLGKGMMGKGVMEPDPMGKGMKGKGMMGKGAAGKGDVGKGSGSKGAPVSSPPMPTGPPLARKELPQPVQPPVATQQTEQSKPGEQSNVTGSAPNDVSSIVTAALEVQKPAEPPSVQPSLPSPCTSSTLSSLPSTTSALLTGNDAIAQMRDVLGSSFGPIHAIIGDIGMEVMHTDGWTFANDLRAAADEQCPEFKALMNEKLKITSNGVFWRLRNLFRQLTTSNSC